MHHCSRRTSVWTQCTSGSRAFSFPFCLWRKAVCAAAKNFGCEEKRCLLNTAGVQYRSPRLGITFGFQGHSKKFDFSEAKAFNAVFYSVKTRLFVEYRFQREAPSENGILSPICRVCGSSVLGALLTSVKPKVSMLFCTVC